MFNFYVHTPAVVPSFVSGSTVRFDDFITLEDGWLESTTELLVF